MLCDLLGGIVGSSLKGLGSRVACLFSSSIGCPDHSVYLGLVGAEDRVGRLRDLLPPHYGGNASVDDLTLLGRDLNRPLSGARKVRFHDLGLSDALGLLRHDPTLPALEGDPLLDWRFRQGLWSLQASLTTASQVHLVAGCDLEGPCLLRRDVQGLSDLLVGQPLIPEEVDL